MLEEMILYTSCQREQRETVQIHKQFENNLLEKIKKLLTNTWTSGRINKSLDERQRTLITEQQNNPENS